MARTISEEIKRRKKGAVIEKKKSAKRYVTERRADWQTNNQTSRNENFVPWIVAPLMRVVVVSYVNFETKTNWNSG